MKPQIRRIHKLVAGLLVLAALAGCTAAARDETTPVPPPTAVVESTQPAGETQALATSRGSALVASDPAALVLESGGPQLIEFFAFW